MSDQYSNASYYQYGVSEPTSQHGTGYHGIDQRGYPPAVGQYESQYGQAQSQCYSSGVSTCTTLAKISNEGDDSTTG